MKKRWKVFWVMCISLGILGAALCISGRLLGATLETVRSTFGIGDMDAYFWSNHYRNAGSTVHETADSSGSYSGYNGVERADSSGSYSGYDGGDQAGSYGSYSGYDTGDAGQRFSDVRELKIDVTCLDVDMEEWDGSEIFVDTSDMNQEILDDFEMTRKDGELKIELNNKNKWDNLVYESKGTLLIRIPEGLQFEEAEIKVGAGQLIADNLRAKELEIEVGAGRVYLDSFTADELSLECGAGEADIYGDTLKKAKIECGVGSVTYSAAGSQEDYNYELECGIGSVTVGGDTYSGLGSEHRINNGGSRSMEIDCGIGLVDVSFDG